MPRRWTAGHEKLDGTPTSGLHQSLRASRFVAAAVWGRDGSVNKLIGDSVSAIFSFPIRHEDHLRRAVQAGLGLQQRCRAIRSAHGNVPADEADVGVGIHTGEFAIGEVGRVRRELTAIGPASKLAARLGRAKC